MKSITFIDKNLYNHRLRVLSRYFRKAYKYVIFEVLPKLGKENKKDGAYQIELPIEELFKKVYGPIIFKFSVVNDVAIIETIEPSKILDDCYKKDLPLYCGIPYATKKDLDKIKIMERLICQDMMKKQAK